MYRVRVFCLVTLLFSSTVRGELMIVPSNLPPGAGYRLAFVTQAARDATSSNIEDYNRFVTAQANLNPELAALGTIWTAMVSTAAVNARSNTDTLVPFPNSPQSPVYRLDGVQLAGDYFGFWSGNLMDVLNVDQTGSVNLDVTRVWTGTRKFGISAVNGELGSANPVYGLAQSQEEEWLEFGTANATQSYALYAVSGVITVSGVPEPSSAFLVLAAAGILPFLRRKRAVGRLG